MSDNDDDIFDDIIIIEEIWHRTIRYRPPDSSLNHKHIPQLMPFTYWFEMQDVVGSSGSLYLFIRFSFPVLIAMMYFKLLYRVVFGCYDAIFDRVCYAFR